MSIPGTTTTDVLGYQIIINEKDSKSVPTIVAYDGSAVSTQIFATVKNLESGHGYWLAYKVLNRAGWSELSPVLEMTAGRLPLPPSALVYGSVSPA